MPAGPKWLLWLVAPIATQGSMTRKMVTRNVGYLWQADNSKSIRELGLQYRSIDTAIVEHFQQLIAQNKVHCKK